MGRKKKSGTRRVQLTVKRDDTVTMDWLSAQSNKCASLRLLIRDAVARYGCVDFFDAKITELYPGSAHEGVREADLLAADAPIAHVEIDEVELIEEEPPAEMSVAEEMVVPEAPVEEEEDGMPVVETVSVPPEGDETDIEALLARMQGGMGTTR